MGGVDKGNLKTIIIHPITQKPCKMPQGGWRYKEIALNQLVHNDDIYFGSDENVIPRKKLYLHDYLFQIPKGINFFDTQSDIRFLKDNMLPFDFPKPKDYIKYFIEMINCNPDSLILDFFSGSATTAHAVMQLNAEDGGRRRFIMVQLPEACAEGSEAAKAGFKNICEIGKERIRRAGKKIAESLAPQQPDENRPPKTESRPDIGFRVLKLDSSNMKDVYFKPQDFTVEMLDGLVDNIKEGRTAEDLLFQTMLELGLPLSSRITRRDVGGAEVFCVSNLGNENCLMACFGCTTPETVTGIARSEPRPHYAVFRDSSFASDAELANFGQIFSAYSPKTIRRVI